MKRKWLLLLAAGGLVIFLITGCGKTAANTAGSNDTENASSLHASSNTVELTEGKYSEDKLDDSWDESSAVGIELDGNSITSSGEGVEIKDNTATITREGIYVLNGTLEDGQIVVDVPDNGTEKASVKLVLNGVSLTSKSSSPIYSKSGKLTVVLADNSENTIADAESYVYEDGADEPGAAIFAKDDLTFNGTGSLTVNGNYKNGIQCKDDLKFVSGSYKVTAKNNGIVGKDSVSVKNGNFTIDAQGDGIKATNYEETDKGYVLIDNGEFHITSGMDGIQAETLLRVNDGAFDIVSGGGSAKAVQETDAMGSMGRPGQRPEDASQEDNSQSMNEQDTSDSSTNEDSTKGLKSYVDLIVAGGTFTLDTCDDGLHSNQNVTVTDGDITVTSGDDGIHADKVLKIDGGTVDVQKSYEGLEGFDIELNGGDIKVTASDDGINAAGDSDSAANPEVSDTSDSQPPEEGSGKMMDRDNKSGMGGGMGGGMAGEDQGASLKITGGTLYVDASGDGLDANGDILISGGNTTVHGPENGGNGTLDYASECKVTGGTLLLAGSNGMIQNPSSSSTQPVIVGTTSQAMGAGTKITVTDSDGKVVAELTTAKSAQWYAVSSSELKEGDTYTIQAGDAKATVTPEDIITEVK